VAKDGDTLRLLVQIVEMKQRNTILYREQRGFVVLIVGSTFLSLFKLISEKSNHKFYVYLFIPFYWRVSSNFLTLKR